MLFVQKGYCRYAGKKCRHLKITGCEGRCSKVGASYSQLFTRSILPQNIPKEGNLKAPSWCPKIKH